MNISKLLQTPKNTQHLFFTDAKWQRYILSRLLGAFWSAAWTLQCATYLNHFDPQTKIYGKLGLHTGKEN